MAADFVLEACVDSLDSALAAKEGGATRLELCANLLIGGTTPMPSLVRRAKAATLARRRKRLPRTKAAARLSSLMAYRHFYKQGLRRLSSCFFVIPTAGALRSSW